MKWFVCLLLIFPFGFVNSQVINEFMDMQIHPTMHVPYRFFGKGLQYYRKEPKLSYLHLLKNANYAQYLDSNCETIFQKEKNDLTEDDKIRFSIGFQSDFNGWLNHSKPRFGKKGCTKSPMENSEMIEKIGMPHIGLLDSQWKYFEKNGVDLQDIKRNSERFLQLWESIQNAK